ncbi:hypothetical protein M0802_009377 [Mischocyttarus mexicanus]|nr:hypothetical protein M0802_009377 [Mischocyttarus mexicanus]
MEEVEEKEDEKEVEVETFRRIVGSFLRRSKVLRRLSRFRPNERIDPAGASKNLSRLRLYFEEPTASVAISNFVTPLRISEFTLE